MSSINTGGYSCGHFEALLHASPAWEHAAFLLGLHPDVCLTPQFFDTVGGAFFARPSARFFVTPMQYAAGPPHGWRAIRADLQLLRPGPPLNASRMFARCNGSAATGGPQSSVETAFYAEWASLGKELTGPNGTVILGHRFECWPGHFRRQRCNDYPDHLGTGLSRSRARVASPPASAATTQTQRAPRLPR